MSYTAGYNLHDMSVGAALCGLGKNDQEHCLHMLRSDAVWEGTLDFCSNVDGIGDAGTATMESWLHS